MGLRLSSFSKRLLALHNVRCFLEMGALPYGVPASGSLPSAISSVNLSVNKRALNRRNSTAENEAFFFFFVIFVVWKMGGEKLVAIHCSLFLFRFCSFS